MKQIENWQSFGGEQQIWQHTSDTLNCDMNVAVFVPSKAKTEPCPLLYWLSGLTCTEKNFIEKSGYQRFAEEYGIIVVAPDTSPRGDDVADDDAYDLGKGAGFYVNATLSPWQSHYQMYDYVTLELPKLIADNFNINQKASISGHSMGGHGALMIGLRNPEAFASISAFSAIVAPMQVPWGQKAFSAYLGNNVSEWQKYDSTELLKGLDASKVPPIMMEQGLADQFLTEQLKPEIFESVAKDKGIDLTQNLRESYDHSYYFVATFIGEHFKFHAKFLSDS